jgi:hypothetical protein
MQQQQPVSDCLFSSVHFLSHPHFTFVIVNQSNHLATDDATRAGPGRQLGYSESVRCGLQMCSQCSAANGMSSSNLCGCCRRQAPGVRDTMPRPRRPRPVRVVRGRTTSSKAIMNEASMRLKADRSLRGHGCGSITATTTQENDTYGRGSVEPERLQQGHEHHGRQGHGKARGRSRRAGVN